MKERFKRRWSLAKAELMDTYVRLSTGDITCLSRKNKASVIIGITAMFLCVMTGQAFATGGNDVISTGGEVADDLYNSLVDVSTKIAAFALGACIVWFFLCTNDDDAKRPLKWGKRIVIAYIIFRLIYPLLDFIADKTSGF